MIDMGMGQEHRVDIGGPERKRPVIQLFFGLRALEHAAIDEQFAPARFRCR